MHITIIGADFLCHYTITFPLQHTFTALITKYPTVFQQHLSCHSVKHDITHHIHTDGPPVNARPQRRSPEKLKAAHQQLEHMLEQGIICPSLSQ